METQNSTQTEAPAPLKKPQKRRIPEIHMLDGYYFFHKQTQRALLRKIDDGMMLGVRLDGRMYIWEKEDGVLHLGRNWFIPSGDKLPGIDTQLFYATDVDDLVVKLREHGLDTYADQVFSKWI